MSDTGDQLASGLPARRHFLKQAVTAGLLILAGKRSLAGAVDTAWFYQGERPDTGCRDPLAGHIDGIL